MRVCERVKEREHMCECVCEREGGGEDYDGGTQLPSQLESE